jgi:hypothetical protein
MQANSLRQKDLVPIFGSESIVSEILHKNRTLNKTQIEKLSKRFRVSPAVFFQIVNPQLAREPDLRNARALLAEASRLFERVR